MLTFALVTALMIGLMSGMAMVVAELLPSKATDKPCDIPECNENHR